MIKVIRDSKEELIESLSEKLNEIGFKVLDKSQDYEKDIHIRIQSKDNAKTDKNLEQAKENIQKIISEFSEKNNVNCEFKLDLKDTTYIDGSVQIKTSKEVNDMRYEYFGTEKLKKIAKSGEAELLKSDGKKEYNDEYYIVINNKKEKLDANSDKEAVKQFKEMFKKKILATDSVEKNTDIINFLQNIKDDIDKLVESCKRAYDYIDEANPDTKAEAREYNLTKQYLDVISETNNGIKDKLDEKINNLKNAHVRVEQPLLDFDNSIADRLNAGEPLRELMKELEQIYNAIPNKEDFEIDYEEVKNKLFRTNNLIAKKKIKERGGNN